ncbi:MAG TPA: hypothetical protein VKS81_05875, partial [Bacteroidota bacterium]|nr:hypothetical protein [Bacteroidota bacterium]
GRAALSEHQALRMRQRRRFFEMIMRGLSVEIVDESFRAVPFDFEEFGIGGGHGHIGIFVAKRIGDEHLLAAEAFAMAADGDIVLRTATSAGEDMVEFQIETGRHFRRFTCLWSYAVNGAVK